MLARNFALFSLFFFLSLTTLVFPFPIVLTPISTAILGIGIFSAILVVGLAYMAANFYQSRQLSIWAKEEFKQLFVSAFLIIFVLTVMSASDVFISATTSVSGSTTIQSTAEAHLDYFTASSVNAFNYLAEFSFYISKKASFSYSVSKMLVPAYANTYMMRAPSAGLSVLSTPIYTALDNLSKIIYAFEIQKLLLAFFSNIIPTLLLPIAFVLRVFPLTRKIGGTLIAVCLGAYLWFPAGVIFASQTYSPDYIYYSEGTQYTTNIRYLWSTDIYDKILENADPGDPPSAGLICHLGTAVFIALGEEFWAWAICAAVAWTGIGATCIPLVKWVYFLFTQSFPFWYGSELSNYASLSQTDFLSNYYNPLVEQILPPLAILYVNSLLSLLITIIVTIIMTRATSSVKGGDAAIYGISKLV